MPIDTDTVSIDAVDADETMMWRQLVLKTAHPIRVARNRTPVRSWIRYTAGSVAAGEPLRAATLEQAEELLGRVHHHHVGRCRLRVIDQPVRYATPADDYQ